MAKQFQFRLFCYSLLVFYLMMVLQQGEVAWCQDGASSEGRKELVPAMFIFGDSLIDNGNNNNLPSFAKANYPPYGIDFSGGPTGRFSNGYTMVDEIAELLGLLLTPAFSEATGDQVLHGVNYASAAAGILDITGRNFVGRVPFGEQIKNFHTTLDQITDNLGAVDVARAIGRCIFFVGMGSNDYLNNYLMPNYDTKNQHNVQQFADLLTQQYTQHLTVGRVPFGEQIKNFHTTLDQITDNLGAVDVARAIGRCIFFVGMGSNDYLNNYLMPNYDTKNQHNVQQFADLLTQQYTQHLTSLYNLGARKFVIAGVGRMGCIPSILDQSPNGTCSEDVNRLVLPFNENVKTMINNLSTNLPSSKFIYIDIARMFEDVIANARDYGISVVNRGCCGIGRNRGQITCLPMQTPCPNRDQYVFWDAFHPTAAVNIIIGRKAFSGDTSQVYPMNIEQLAILDNEAN